MKMKTATRPPAPRRVPRRMVKTLHARAAASGKDFEEYEGDAEPNMRFSHALVVVLVLHILAVGGVFAFNSLKSHRIAPERSKPAAAPQAMATPATDEEPAPSSRTVPDTKARDASTTPVAAADKPSAKGQPAESSGSTYTVAAGDTLTRIATGHKTTVEAIEQANGIGNSSAIRVGQVLKIPSKAAPPPVKAPAKQESVVQKTGDAKPAPAAKAAEVKPAAATKPPAAKTAETKPASAAKTGDTAAAQKSPAPAARKEEGKPAAAEKSYTVAKGDNPYSIAKKLKVGYSDLIKANNIEDPTKLQIGQKLIVP